MRGAGGMLTFVIRGGLEAARAFLNAVRIFACAESLGGVESLIEWRRKHDPEAPPALLRISVGLEDADDLAADLARGLAAVRGSHH
jgi:cystathionine gamma-synthase